PVASDKAAEAARPTATKDAKAPSQEGVAEALPPSAPVATVTEPTTETAPVQVAPVAATPAVSDEPVPDPRPAKKAARKRSTATRKSAARKSSAKATETPGAESDAGTPTKTE